MSLRSVIKEALSPSLPAPEPQPPFVIDPDAPEPLEPLYFVTHPDNSFSVADPQPTTIPHSREQFAALRHQRDILQFEREQLKFLLGCAPMIDAVDPTLLNRGATAFAYIHPETFAKLTRGRVATDDLRFPPSPTRWICTSLMPKDRVIFTPNPLPGTEKRNEAHAVANRNTRKPRR